LQQPMPGKHTRQADCKDFITDRIAGGHVGRLMNRRGNISGPATRQDHPRCGWPCR